MARTTAASAAAAALTTQSTFFILLRLDIVTNPSSHFLRRLIWAIAVTVCLALVIVHGSSLIQRYFTYPTRVQLDVSNRQEMTLPAITICPLDRFDLVRLKQLWLATNIGSSSGGQLPNASEQYYQLADRFAVDDLWRRIAYENTRLVFPMCYIGRGTDCEDVGQFEPVWTSQGTCFTYSSKQKTLTGHFNGIYLRLNISHSLDSVVSLSGWKITLHQVGTSPVLLSSRQFLEMSVYYVERNWSSSSSLKYSSSNVSSQFSNVKLTGKEFIQVNHPQKPCLGVSSSINDDFNIYQTRPVSLCEMDCFERAFINVTRCKLPYMRTDRVPYCNTSASVRQAESFARQLLRGNQNQLQCRCLEPCTKIIYKYESESYSAEYNYSRLKVYYDKTLWLTVREIYVYSWVKLVCDVGNLLCLLLGASVLNLFELFEFTLLKIGSRFIRRPRRIQ